MPTLARNGTGGSPFDLAVGLWPVGTCAFVDDRSEGIDEGAGSVAGTIVGQHFSDGSAGGGEPGVGAGPERGGGVFAFIGEQFGVGEPGMIIQGSA